MQGRTDVIKSKLTGPINLSITNHAVTLTTDRLIYLSYHQLNTAALSCQLGAILGNPENVKMYCEGKPWSQTRVNEYVQRHTLQWNQDNLYASLAVFDTATNTLIGNLGIYYPVETYEKIGRGHHNVAEIGYIIDHKYWGKGFGTEIATVGKKYINYLANQFNKEGTQSAPVEVTATSHPENKASKRILEKVLKNSEDVIFKKHNGNPRLMFFKPIKKVSDDAKKINDSPLICRRPTL